MLVELIVQKVNTFKTFPQFIDGSFHTWLVRPDFYSEHVDKIFGQAQQHGIWNYLLIESENLVFRRYTTRETHQHVDQIQMDQLKFIFLITCAAYSLEILIFVIEIVWVKLFRKTKKK